MILAQDILIDNSSYPTAEITANAHAFRELGLGYANLGALLMSLGLPYDSDGGRAYAAAVTALMSGQGYLQSARNAAATGTFAGYDVNRQPMLRVLNKHRSQAYKISPSHVPLDLLTAAREAWDQTCAEAEKYGVKNSQISVLAPTGTIAFMMDCDTTGVEPDIALIKYKKLVGGGLLKIVNQHRAAGAASGWATMSNRSKTSSSTSKNMTPSRGRRISGTTTCRCSTAPSRPPTAAGRFITWAMCE